METGTSESASQRKAVENERSELLNRLECWFEKPMIVLAFVWLALLIVEFTHGQSRWLQVTSTAIWILFIIDFLVRLIIAPVKLRFLKSNWLTALSLVVPALRGLRIFALLRIVRVSRGLRLLRVLASVNRGMAALGATMQRRKLGTSCS